MINHIVTVTSPFICSSGIPHPHGVHPFRGDDHRDRGLNRAWIAVERHGRHGRQSVSSLAERWLDGTRVFDVFSFTGLASMINIVSSSRNSLSLAPGFLLFPSSYSYDPLTEFHILLPLLSATSLPKFESLIRLIHLLVSSLEDTTPRTDQFATPPYNKQDVFRFRPFAKQVLLPRGNHSREAAPSSPRAPCLARPAGKLSQPHCEILQPQPSGQRAKLPEQRARGLREIEPDPIRLSRWLQIAHSGDWFRMSAVFLLRSELSFSARRSMYNTIHCWSNWKQGHKEYSKRVMYDLKARYKNLSSVLLFTMFGWATEGNGESVLLHGLVLVCFSASEPFTTRALSKQRASERWLYD